MRAISRPAIGIWIVAAIGIAAIAMLRTSSLGRAFDPDFATGWILLAIIIALALYGVRKKIPMLPLGRASVWLSLHVVGGAVAIAAYAIHVGTLWPAGAADRALALGFALVFLSGVAGHLLQAVLPTRLARSGPELLYERIPAEIARLRDAAAETILGTAAVAGHTTLSDFYAQTLAWYFERPRFAVDHIVGGQAAATWERLKLGAIERLLTDEERPNLAALAAICARKRAVDAQYALQSLLRAWTFVHVPAASAFLVMALWHSVLVHVYAG